MVLYFYFQWPFKKINKFLSIINESLFSRENSEPKKKKLKARDLLRLELANLSTIDDRGLLLMSM